MSTKKKKGFVSSKKKKAQRERRDKGHNVKAQARQRMGGVDLPPRHGAEAAGCTLIRPRLGEFDGPVEYHASVSCLESGDT